MEPSDRISGEGVADGRSVIFPHVFNVSGRHMEHGLDLADAIAHMVRESKSGLGQVYEADSELAFGEAESLRDYKL